MSNSANTSAGKRIEALLDDNSFVEVGAYVKARSTDFNMAAQNTAADGVITGYGTIEGNLVYVYSQDASVMGGSVGEMQRIPDGYENGSSCDWPGRLLWFKASGGDRRSGRFWTDVSESDHGFRRSSADLRGIWKLRRRHGCFLCDCRFRFHGRESKDVCQFSKRSRWK